jgi:hypothetical protein
MSEAVKDRELFRLFMSGASLEDVLTEHAEVRLRAFVNGMVYAADMKGENDDD